MAKGEAQEREGRPVGYRPISDLHTPDSSLRVRLVFLEGPESFGLRWLGRAWGDLRFVGLFSLEHGLARKCVGRESTGWRRGLLADKDSS